MTDTIRTRRDGSIDTAYYMTQGRQKRAEAATWFWQRRRPNERR